MMKPFTCGFCNLYSWGYRLTCRIGCILLALTFCIYVAIGYQNIGKKSYHSQYISNNDYILKRWLVGMATLYMCNNTFIADPLILKWQLII